MGKAEVFHPHPKLPIAFLTLQEVGKLRHGEGGGSHPAPVAPGCWGPPGRAPGRSKVPGAT